MSGGICCCHCCNAFDIDTETGGICCCCNAFITEIACTTVAAAAVDLVLRLAAFDVAAAMDLVLRLVAFVVAAAALDFVLRCLGHVAVLHLVQRVVQFVVAAAYAVALMLLQIVVVGLEVLTVEYLYHHILIAEIADT